MTGVADADLDQAPLVALTAQGGFRRRHHESHQLVEVTSLFKPITRWSSSVYEPSVVAEVKAGCIVEGADLPVTCAADAGLRERDVCVIPDILANAGGVVASYLEWAQDRQHYRWPRQRVLEEVEAILRRVWKRARALVEHEKISHRQTACRIAVQQVHEAMKLRGF